MLIEPTMTLPGSLDPPFNLAASLINIDRRLTLVASGFKTKNSRSRESAKILNWGVRKFDTIKVAKTDEVILSLDVWHGRKNKVEVIPSEDIYLTIPKRKKKIIKAIIESNAPVEAPIKKGDILGTLNVYVSGDLKKQINISLITDG